MLGKIEMRLAIPEDFKIRNGTRDELKQGAIYFVEDMDLEDKMQGCFVLSYAQDLEVFKELLEAEMIYVPLVDENLVEFLKPI
jgi:hypothetical protein